MTIVEAIKTVLYQVPDGLTSKEIYDEIVKQNLYSFGAKNPLGVVNSQIRRRCAGLDFPTAYPVKVFRIAGHRGNKKDVYKRQVWKSRDFPYGIGPNIPIWAVVSPVYPSGFSSIEAII